jgi:hypothetical protein
VSGKHHHEGTTMSDDEKNYVTSKTIDDVKVGDDLYVNVEYDYSVKINQYVTISDVVATKINKWDCDTDTAVPLDVNTMDEQTYNAVVAGFPMQWVEERIKFNEGM